MVLNPAHTYRVITSGGFQSYWLATVWLDDPEEPEWSVNIAPAYEDAQSYWHPMPHSHETLITVALKNHTLTPEGAVRHAFERARNFTIEWLASL